MPCNKRMPNNQRKAMFAKLNNSHLTRHHPLQDSDGDGVINRKDCNPIDPKKQGFLHKFTINRIKKQEEKVERQQSKAREELKDTMDELKQRSKLSSKKVKLKTTELKQKQVVIDELNREKKKLASIKKLNEDSQKELDKFTLSGKTKRVASSIANSTYDKSQKALKAAEERWNLPSNQAHRAKMTKSATKTLKKLGKKIFD